MIRTIISVCLVAALSLLMACVTVIDSSNEGAASPTNQGATATAIKGIWTIEEMDVGIGENKRTTVPPAFMIFIGEKYYSAIRDFSDPPRKDMSSGTGAFMADAGTYEYDGSTFVVHHQVAMIANMMQGGSSMTFGCHMEGPNTLILTPQYDKMVIPGMQIKPSPDGKMGYGDMAVLYKFRRLE
ncbi:MAG: hypothetical protein JW882_20200 [Deltaproteobacteria bacterium]|nr:hypothetical protein [Deltaproteobacteria bacterium]